MMRVPNRDRQVVKAQFLRLSRKTGIKSNLCGDIKYFQVGKTVEIPVFNTIGEKASKPTAEVVRMAAAGTSFIWLSGIDNLPDMVISTMFPVVTFDSCNVSFEFEKKSEYCPGFTLAQKKNPTIPIITTSVEGLLLSNYDSPLNLREKYHVNFGNYQVSLIK